MAGKALPLLLLGGAAFVAASKKKRRKSTVAPQPSPRPGPYTPPQREIEKPPGLPSSISDEDMPYVSVYPSRNALEQNEWWAINNRPKQNYVTMLIGDWDGLTDEAKGAFNDWADENWDRWELQLAPIDKTGDLANNYYAARVWRTEVNMHIGLWAEELDKDARDWTRADILTALNRAKGEITPELAEELMGGNA